MVKNHMVTPDKCFYEWVILSYKNRMQIGNCKFKITDQDSDPHLVNADSRSCFEHLNNY
jgi:hypothetical protein